MEKLTLERQNNKSYLVGRVPEGCVVDEDCLATISEEKAGEEREGFMGVVPVIYSQLFQERILKYDINAYLPLAEYKPRITSREQLRNFFLSIIDTYQKAESYLLDTGFFLLEEEYVYVDEATGKACLILYPVVGMAQDTDLRQLFCRMMNGIHLVERDMGFYGKIIYELNYAETFNIVKFRELLSSQGVGEHKGASHGESGSGSGGSQGNPGVEGSFHGNPMRPGAMESPMQPGGQRSMAGGQDDFPDLHGGRPEKGTGVKKKEGVLGSLFGGTGRKNKPSGEKGSKENTAGKRGRTPSGGSNLFMLPDEEVGISPRVPKPREAMHDPGRREPLAEIPKTADEDIFSSYAKTVDGDDRAADAACKKTLELFYCNEKRVIRVTIFPFEIGREGSGCRIDPSKGKVSRRHAVLQWDGERFQICDVSKLGTTLNGERLPKDTYVDLADGMRIDMKGEIFEVRIIEG